MSIDRTPSAHRSSDADNNEILVDAAARALGWLLAVVGTGTLVSGLVSMWNGPAGHLGGFRVPMGMVFLLIGAVSEGLRRRGRPRLGSGLALISALLAMAGYAVLTQLGVHALMFAAATLVIALGGILVNLRFAVLLTVLDLLLVALLFALERQGVIAGFAALAPAQTHERLLTLPMLAVAGLATAALVSRMVEGSLQHARQQEQRLAQLLQLGADWSVELDEHGVIRALSPGFEARTGRRVSEFLQVGRPGGPTLVQDAAWRQLLEQMRRREPFRDAVTTYQCADGTVLVACTSGEPVFGADGRFAGWRAVSRDVTAETLAERARHRTQGMLDRIVRTSPDPIFVARGDGTVLMANDEFLRAAGRPLDEVVGRTVWSLGVWAKDESRRLRDALRASPVVRDFRTLLFSSDRGVRTVSVTAGLFDWDGALAAVITSRDTTDIEQARAEGDAILDNAAVGIALVRDRRFQRVNPLFAQMFGHTPGSLAGQPTSALFPDDERFRAFAAKSDAWQRRDGLVDIERRVTRKDGSRFVARLRARPLDPSRPLEGGTIWVTEDITERRRTEQELAEAKQQAEAANEAKSAFLATMSHEIRTPLNGVLGLARLLQDHSLSTARRDEYLQHLIAAAEQLTGIVSDVLDLSKIEAGQLDIEDIAFDLHHMVHDTFNTFALLGRERGLVMECDVAASLPLRVRGDPVRVRQILANYLSNALKFTERGGISLTAEPGGEDRIRFCVSDTGIGLSDELRERLFRPFTQADSSTTRRFGGTGLGLSICAQLAHRMGGEVGAGPAGDGRGSSFWVELRLPPLMPVAATHAPPDTPLQPLQGLRVIVAEDNPVNMLIVTAMLNRQGCEVLPAEDGREALALAEAAATAGPPVHAILMDLHMPTLDGLEATRQLRAAPWGAVLPVFALSAAVLEQERREADRAGMNGFIAKPVEDAELRRLLEPMARAVRGG